MSAQVAKCPRCGNDELTLIETHEEHGVVGPARHRVVDGQIIPAAPFDFEVGDPIRVLLQCKCGHEWRSRRSVGCEVGA